MTNPVFFQEIFSRYLGESGWNGVDALAYKDEDGNPSFKHVTRMKLVAEGSPDGTELRYFEIGVGGHTTLEKHEHTHTVIPIKGEGAILVEDRVLELKTNDVVYVPTWAWHQVRAVGNEPFGFLCIVKVERDRPTLPTAQEIEELKLNPEIAQFIKPRAVNP